MSIAVQRVWNRVNDLAKKDQSGYNTVAEFNNRLDQVQLEIIEAMFTYLGYTQRADDILAPFVTQITLVTNSSGVMSDPADAHHFLSMSYQYTPPTGPVIWVPMRYLEASEVAITAINPNRNANPAKGRVQYYSQFDNTVVSTLAVSTVSLVYLKRPPIAQIAFINTFAGGQYSQTYDATNSVNLIWDDTAFNLIVYLMLEKLGVEIREQYLTEFSQVLGIKREMIHKND